MARKRGRFPCITDWVFVDLLVLEWRGGWLEVDFVGSWAGGLVGTEGFFVLEDGY